MKKKTAILICLTAMALMGCGTVSDSTDSKKEVAIEQHNNKETQEAIPSIGNVTKSNKVTEEAATEEIPEEYECGLIIKNITASKEQEDITAPEAEAREVYEDLKSLPVEIQKVLYENGSFYEVYNQREYTRLNYEGTHYKRSTPQELAMWGHYIVLDFDGDGEKELAVMMREDCPDCFVEVFDVQEDKVYAYENPYRGFLGIYTDGTLEGSSGASVGRYYMEKFDGNRLEKIAIAGQDADTWYVTDRILTEEEYDAYIQKRYGDRKTWVEWSRKTIDETLDENR